MGLYGLVSFMVVKKTREIGIRKANGATTGGIIKMYIISYLKFILLASIPAWPVAYHLMNRWLRDYAYHIKLTIEYFIAGLLIIVLIALFTILFQTLKTANTNPAQTLRDE
jgi:putative ABC transport system permease protein